MNPYEAEIERLRGRRANFGLLRFAAGWGIGLSIVSILVPSIGGWGFLFLAIAVAVFILGWFGMHACEQAAMRLTEHMLFGTPEGRQAIQDEAARRLRERDY